MTAPVLDLARLLARLDDVEKLMFIDAIAESMRTDADPIKEGCQDVARNMVVDTMRAHEDWTLIHDERAHDIYPQHPTGPDGWELFRQVRDGRLRARGIVLGETRRAA